MAIFVLGEQPLLRYGISAYLNSQPDMMVCGEAESLLNARSKIAQCQPQLVLTGLRLGTGDSLKSIKKLKAEIPRLLILVYSALEERIFAERAMRAGASGYVMTQAPTDALTVLKSCRIARCTFSSCSARGLPIGRSQHRWI